jgi:hypothetical protein
MATALDFKELGSFVQCVLFYLGSVNIKDSKISLLAFPPRLIQYLSLLLNGVDLSGTNPMLAIHLGFYRVADWAGISYNDQHILRPLFLYASARIIQ